MCYSKIPMHLGIDVGGTAVKAGLVDDSGRILEILRQRTNVRDLDEFVSALVALVDHFRAQVAVAAIGIGVPGLRSSQTHEFKVSPNIPCLRDVNLERLLGDRLRTPVLTENDANLGAYAEYRCGSARGLENMVCLTIGTGLGSGMILKGELFVGSSGYAGEVGHTVVEPEGRICGCGNRGCLETIVSGTGIVERARTGLAADSSSVLLPIAADLDAERIFNAAKEGDALALRVFRETGTYLGMACANIINLLNVDMIVIGGGVMASGSILLDSAIEEARRRAFADSFRACRITPAQLGPQAGVIGAALFARDHLR